ncbi:hypothetical protein COCMIDRAFT_36177 [Bipolaris oryzae ATCC 44560]|uniref:UBC core domain-containing protein n=1 Tax=Bipolaris oryzae ATCC 44560 TaxID=930090 RepID=W6Z8B9_COCMI|nr:uncharacterized protein COCMIDRAFT_36177 [Bipolaris oryzae ATCC 44560]EUC46215.1 hypothetical protein COCMIDRAFT_36177 [Bipolaris oryzae ATCC 44560]
MTLKRIAQELTILQRDPIDTFSAGPAETGNLYHWVGYIMGPPDTPFEREKFAFAITFPENYPVKPFKLNFTSPISHPNVSDEGIVLMPELGEEWSPAQTVRSILICLQVLLTEPDLSTPYD